MMSFSPRERLVATLLDILGIVTGAVISEYI